MALFRAGATIPPGALALAARGGLDTFIKALLAKGVPPEPKDDWGYTPLHLAAKYGHASTLRLLLAAKASPSPKASNDGFTPLHLAVIDRHLEAISVLISGGADLEAKDDQGRTPLHWAPFAYMPQPKHIYRKLGAPHDTVFTDPGPAKGMSLLLNAGAKIDAVDDEGDTPLHDAVRLGSVRGVETLLARGAKTNVKNKAGETPLSMAKQRENDEILRMLERKR
jgi:ankyrin repeat protein